MDIKEKYRKWLGTAEDIALKNQLLAMTEPEINDAFYKDLEFGASGLRGLAGAGTNRVNNYTVGRAAQGLFDFLKETASMPLVAIAFDSRINSEQLARAAAGVLAANGAEIYIFSQLMPAPVLSYAVKAFECDAGIMITVSHNPAAHNCCRVYGNDGCPIAPETAGSIQKCIEKVDIFSGVKNEPFEKAEQAGLVHFVSQDILESYLERVERFSENPAASNEPDMTVIYTPPAETLRSSARGMRLGAGFNRPAAFPGPENLETGSPAFQRLAYAEQSVFEIAAALAEVTAPAPLRSAFPSLGRAVAPEQSGREYMRLSANETAVLPPDTVLSRRRARNGLLPSSFATIAPAAGGMTRLIATEYDAQPADSSAGIRYTAGQAGDAEPKPGESDYEFRFEEAPTALPELFVRDREARSSSLMICDMAVFYKKIALAPPGQSENLYKKYGYWQHKLLSLSFEGARGMAIMQAVMNNFRKGRLADHAVLPGIQTGLNLSFAAEDRETANKYSRFLARADVVLYSLEKNCEIIIRPSGTEQKLKCYLTVRSNDNYSAIQMLNGLEAYLTSKIKSFLEL